MNSELKRLRLIDWDFPSRTSQVLMHDICWYPARFVPAIPAHLIDTLSSPGDLICDPFCGSGTTIVEALLLNRRGYGIDVNPYAIHIAETKCRLATYPGMLRKRAVSRLLQEVEGLILKAQVDEAEVASHSQSPRGSRPRSPTLQRQPDLFETMLGPPEIRDRSVFLERPDRWLESFETQKQAWYHVETLRQLSTLFELVREVDDPEVRQVLETVFIATLMPASGHRAKRPYGYFADNVVPREKLYRNAFSLFYTRLTRLAQRVKTMEEIPDAHGRAKYQLCSGDATQPESWGNISFDAIITSPPYPGAVDYSTAFRLASHWFPWYGAVERLREAEIGPRWCRRRKTSREEYFDKMHAVFENMTARLRFGGTLAIVLPKGRSQTPTIQRLLRDLSNLCNLTEVARVERRILKRYFVRRGGGIKTELVIVLRKESRAGR